MTDLYYPTLDLFIYNLNKGLGVDKATPESNRLFWENLPQHLKQVYPQIDIVEETANKLILQDKKYDTKSTVDGLYQHLQLEDTDAYLVDWSVDDRVNPQPISCITNLKKLILPPPTGDLTLGQTWTISGWVAPATDAELEVLAKQAYKHLLGNEWQYQQQGKFLGGTIFEAWRSPKFVDTPEPGTHVLIIFYPDELAMQAAGKFYQDWLYLLCYRHKILSCYQKTRQLKLQLQENFNQIVPDLQNSSDYNLRQLKAALQKNMNIISSYSINLKSLEIQIQTIDTNSLNYETYLKEIEKKAREIKRKDPSQLQNQLTKVALTDLSFLHKFSHIVSQKYQK